MLFRSDEEGEFSGQFDTETEGWNRNYRRGLIYVSLSKNKTPKKIGETIVHELLHSYFKKRLGLDHEIEEVIVEAADEELFLHIRRRIRKRIPRFGEDVEVSTRR